MTRARPSLFDEPRPDPQQGSHEEAVASSLLAPETAEERQQRLLHLVRDLRDAVLGLYDARDEISKVLLVQRANAWLGEHGGGEDPSPVAWDVFAGLRCPCGQPHTPRANYYVSLLDGARLILAAGPFAEHCEALAAVETVCRLVEERRASDPDAPAYRYGTVALPPEQTEPGALNALLGATRARVTPR